MDLTNSLFRAALRRPRAVATIFPTGPWVARQLVRDVRAGQRVVELGPGSGAITRHLPNDVLYVGVEVDPALVSGLRARFPTFHFEVAGAQDLARHVAPASVDVAIASLPWTLLSAEVRAATLAGLGRSLRPDGRLSTYVCLHVAWTPGARRFTEELRDRFESVDSRVVEWRNAPPARVFHARRPRGRSRD